MLVKLTLGFDGAESAASLKTALHDATPKRQLERPVYTFVTDSLEFLLLP